MNDGINFLGGNNREPEVRQEMKDEQIAEMNIAEENFNNWVDKSLEYIYRRHKEFIKKYWFPFWR